MTKQTKKIYGHSVAYWRSLYEREFGRDTSKENDEQFLKNHKCWIKANKDDSYHC